MRITLTKGTDHDHLRVEREDGTSESTRFPRKMGFPHDAVHFVVEQSLRFERAFWGRVADGASPLVVASVAKAGGHASSKRAGQPAHDIVELIQAERIVECFEAEIGAESTDVETWRSVFAAACAQSRVAVPDLSSATIERIRDRLRIAARQWDGLGVGESLELYW